MKNNKLDAWGDYVEEYSKRQKQLHKELVDRKLMEMELENTISDMKNNEWMKGRPTTDEEINELRKQFKNNTIQTNQNTTRTQIKLWSMSVLAVITFFGCTYLIATNKTALFVFGITVGVSAIVGLIIGIKGLIEGACEEIKMNRK